MAKGGWGLNDGSVRILFAFEFWYVPGAGRGTCHCAPPEGGGACYSGFLHYAAAIMLALLC